MLESVKNADISRIMLRQKINLDCCDLIVKLVMVSFCYIAFLVCVKGKHAGLPLPIWRRGEPRCSPFVVLNQIEIRYTWLLLSSRTHIWERNV